MLDKSVSYLMAFRTVSHSHGNMTTIEAYLGTRSCS